MTTKRTSSPAHRPGELELQDGTPWDPAELGRELTPAEQRVAAELAAKLPLIANNHEPPPGWLEETLARVRAMASGAGRTVPKRRKPPRRWAGRLVGA